jgi:hypothetical protein
VQRQAPQARGGDDQDGCGQGHLPAHEDSGDGRREGGGLGAAAEHQSSEDREPAAAIASRFPVEPPAQHLDAAREARSHGRRRLLQAPGDLARSEPLDVAHHDRRAVGLAQLGDRLREPALEGEPLERISLGSDLVAARLALARSALRLAALPRAGDASDERGEEGTELRALPSLRRPHQRRQPRLLHDVVGLALAHEGARQRVHPGLLAEQGLGLDR